MGRIKTVHAVYAAWDYEKEIEDINKASEEGWQLVHGGCFRSKYEEDKDVVYRYQIDFDQHIDNKIRYIEAFREQGWEYINSTFNGWHYFRKVYDPSLPEEEYEIYTDRPSKAEMAGRWMRFSLPLTIFIVCMEILLLVRCIQAPELSRAGLLLEYSALTYMFVRGTYHMNQLKKGIETHRKFHFSIMFLVLFAGILWFSVFSEIKESQSVSMETTIDSDTQPFENYIDVKCKDYYYLDAEVSAKVETTMTIEDTAGQVVFMQTGDSFVFEDKRLMLNKGRYYIRFTYDTSAANGSEASVKYQIN